MVLEVRFAMRRNRIARRLGRNALLTYQASRLKYFSAASQWSLCLYIRATP
jgi:hypothetical protein